MKYTIHWYGNPLDETADNECLSVMIYCVIISPSMCTVNLPTAFKFVLAGKRLFLTVCYFGYRSQWLFLPLLEVQSIVISVSVCLSTHISQKPDVQIFCTCYLWPWLCHSLMHFRFCG